MPAALAAMPLKMLPPPITMATWTPRSMTSRISAPTRSSTGGSIPYPWSPASASPESFRTMRRYRGRPAASAAATDSASDPEAGKSLDDDPLARLGVGQVDEVLDLRLAARVFNKRLLEQALLGEILLELALDDLVEHLGGLLLVRHLAAVDLALLLEHGRRHLFACHVCGVRRGHLHREVADELAECVRLRHEVRLAVDLDQGAQLAVRMQIGVDDAFLRLAPFALLGIGQALLPQVLGGGVEVAVRGCQSSLAVHHA